VQVLIFLGHFRNRVHHRHLRLHHQEGFVDGSVSGFSSRRTAADLAKRGTYGILADGGHRQRDRL
jgi:hypothetical protein